MTRFTLLSAIALLLAAMLSLQSEAREPAAPAATKVVFERDVEIRRTEHGPLTLNLARPASVTKPLPCIIVIHGGGWASGRKEQHDDLIRVLADEGYVAATVTYGLCPKCPWPAQILDVKAAVRFLRRNAKTYGIDPARVAALGFSAGAHLAMLLGTLDPADGLEGPNESPGISSKVQAVVAYFGPTDMERLADTAQTDMQRKMKRRALNTLLGPNFAADATSMSPAHYVDPTDAPMLIFQGTRDRLVPYSQALHMLERLHDAKIKAEITFLVGAGHGWRDPLLSATVAQTQHFLDRMFRPERVSLFTERLRAARR